MASSSATIPGSGNNTAKVYQSVIDDVINNVRESFQDDGYDENSVIELKQLWESKLKNTKVVDLPSATQSNPTLRTSTTTVPVSISQTGQQFIQINGQHFILQNQTTQPNQVYQVDGQCDADDLKINGQNNEKSKGKIVEFLLQNDGVNDSSSSSDEHSSVESEKEDEEEERGEKEASLNSQDDVSDEDPGEVFEVDNLVVCLYDKINRNKSKWKFILKEGIMNLKGKDYVFQKATGESEW